ncbi:MAG TPA: hypothetical protein VFQ61_09190 [Polyangiaceae bacterium]|nr:hypothetical protein [Polyangiaceae bacterium]
MSKRLLGFVRSWLVRERRAALFGVASRETAAPRDSVAVELISVDHLPRGLSLPPGLGSSWAALGHVRGIDAQVLADVLTVLLETLPDPQARPKRQANLEAAPAPPRATAAHPRGYRGTKSRPPKPALPERLDLRGDLISASDVARQLIALESYLPEALALLEGRGYSKERLTRTRLDANLYLAYHHGAERGDTLGSLPTDFVRWVLPALRRVGESSSAVAGSVDVTMQQVRDWLTLWRLFEGKGEIQSWVSVLAQRAPSCATWLTLLLLSLPDERRELGLHALSGLDLKSLTGAIPEDALAELLRRFETLSSAQDADTYTARLRYLLNTAAQRGAVELCLDAFALANTWHPSAVPKKSPRDASARAVDLEAYLAYADVGSDVTFGYWLFEHCGELPGLARLIRDTAWKSFSPQTAYTLGCLWRGAAWEDISEERLLEKWGFIASEIPRSLAWLSSVPEAYRERASTLLFEFLLGPWHEPQELAARRAAAYAIANRLASAPFSTHNRNAWIVVPLVRHLHARPLHLDRFLAAPEATWAALDAALRRHNEGRLTIRGLDKLMKYLPEFTIGALARHPAQLLSAAHTVGALHYDYADRFVQAFSAHPLLVLLAHESNEGDASPTPAADAEALVRALLPYVEQVGFKSNPVPRRLRESFATGSASQLSAGQLARHIRVLRVGLEAFCVTFLRELVLKELRRGLPLDTEQDPVRHALLIERSAELNKRPLRRLIEAWADGNTEYLSRHPATQAFRRRHSRLDARTWELWLNGIVLEGRVSTHGTEWIEGRGAQQVPLDGSVEGQVLELSVERSPLEVLKLGTYVGSCLGLGGSFSFSAAAAALDINKRVIYARDPQGVVVARQLVALSEDDRLVCFHVYPLGLPAPLRELFRRYDEAWSAELGLPLFVRESSDRDYEIAPILSRDWWDDGAWDFEIAD